MDRIGALCVGNRVSPLTRLVPEIEHWDAFKLGTHNRCITLEVGIAISEKLGVIAFAIRDQFEIQRGCGNSTIRKK